MANAKLKSNASKQSDEYAKETEKARALADKAYLSLRKKQGKAIITQSQLADKYPWMPELTTNKYTQEELHQVYESLEYLSEASHIKDQASNLETATRKILFKILTRGYRLFRQICVSPVAQLTLDNLRDALYKNNKVRTHEDTPPATILLKYVFNTTPDKTIHLYSRAYQLANGYDIEAESFTDFVKELGGLEKIRKAYAHVLAADCGKLPRYVRDNEATASNILLWGKPPKITVQLTREHAKKFRNDEWGFCLLLCNIDLLNQLEIYGKLPITPKVKNIILDAITNRAKDSGDEEWYKLLGDVTKQAAITVEANLVQKAEAQRKKDDLAKKKAASLAKKQAAAEKRFAAQRKKAAAAKAITSKS